MRNGEQSETAADRGRVTCAYCMTIADAFLVPCNAETTITHHSRAKICDEETSNTPWPTICGHDHADASDAAAGGNGSAEASLANIDNGQRAKLQGHKGKPC